MIRLLLGLAGASTVAAVLGWGLYLNARDAIIEEREQCNADRLSETVRSQVEIIDRLRADAERRRARQDAELEAAANAVAEAGEAAAAAQVEADQVGLELERLRAQARRERNEPIEPAECLSVAVPDSVLDRLFND